MPPNINQQRAEQAVQPVEGVDDPAGVDVELFRELCRFEQLTEAQRLERLTERNIITTLQLCNFQVSSAEWQELAQALAEYGYAVFVGWGITGALYRVAAQHAGGRGVYGLGKIPENLRLGEDNARALAAELLMVAIEAFRSKSLMDPRRTWSPTGGASLKTYFVGRCLMELPDVYVEWDRRERRPIHDHAGPDLTVDDGRHGPNPADQAEASARVAELVDGDGVIRVMFELQQAGYSLQEIAEMLTAAGIQVSEGSIRTRMSRFRTTARRRETTDG